MKLLFHIHKIDHKTKYIRVDQYLNQCEERCLHQGLRLIQSELNNLYRGNFGI